MYIYIKYICGYIHICIYAAAAAAKLLQSCPTLCDPIDSSPPGSAIPGILQARACISIHTHTHTHTHTQTCVCVTLLNLRSVVCLLPLILKISQPLPP